MDLSRNPAAESLLTRIERYLANHNTRAYIVGGFLRDLLLARDTADIDIALEADSLDAAPQLAAYLGGKFVPLDKINHAARIILPEPAGYPGSGRWQVDLSTIEGSIEQDLARRDFTIDAMAISLERITKGAAATDIIDPFNGLADIKQRAVRATSDTAFEADAARLLRAVRLAAELGFTISRQTEALMQQHSRLVTNVAGERVREELLRLLATGNSGKLLLYLDELGLLVALIPELKETKRVEQPREHQWDVFNHSIKAVDAVDFVLRKGSWRYAGKKLLDYVPWSTELEQHFEAKVSSGSNRRLLLKIAALLHDIAKPQTKMVNAKGRTRFLGHPRIGAPIAAAILERLRFSTREVKLVAAVVRHHLRPVQISHDELPTRRAIYRYFRDTGDAAIDTLFFSLADHLATRGTDLDIANWRQHAGLIDYVMTQRSRQESTATPARLINGHDLMKNFDLSPGPEIGRLLEAILEAQACQEITTKDEALAYASRLLTSKEGD